MLLGPQRERRVGAGPSVTQGTVTGSEQGGRPGRSGGGSERGGSFGTRPLPADRSWERTCVFRVLTRTRRGSAREPSLGRDPARRRPRAAPALLADILFFITIVITCAISNPSSQLRLPHGTLLRIKSNNEHWNIPEKNHGATRELDRRQRCGPAPRRAALAKFLLRSGPPSPSPRPQAAGGRGVGARSVLGLCSLR